LRLKVIAVGTKMPKWVETGSEEYTKRLGADLRIEWMELPLGKRGKGADLARAIQAESDAMLAAIGKDDTVVALDVKGKSWSTEDLAAALKTWQMSGRNISLLIGGPDGLSPECLARAQQRWSLSALTFPHPLVRVILAEQMYRAWSINNNHPYHRA
jgi:23S rRNA (pseudouridine1915-N3)-methyltransferase